MAAYGGCASHNGNVIDITGLKKGYTLGDIEVPILQGIDLCIKNGEFVAIMGPAGSGKSTLMNMIGCLDRPTEGKVMLKGRDTSTITDNELTKLRGSEIGFVFQNHNLIPCLSAYENVMLSSYSSCKKGVVSSTRARDLLKLVGLDDHIDHLPSELSAGQKEKVTIARSLLNIPSLILADEPAGKMDSETSEEIMEIYSYLRKKGQTIVMLTCNPDVIKYADRVVHIRDGCISNN